MPTLTVAFTQRGNIFESDIYIAQAEGIFAKHGVKVNFVYNQNPANLLVAGETDLVVDPVTSAIATALQGQELRLISTQVVNNRLDLVSSPNIKSLADLEAKGNKCLFGNAPPGSVTYAYAVNFMKVLNLSCKQITDAGNAADFVTGVITGRFDAAVIAPFYAVQAEAQGGHILVNALNPDFTFSSAYDKYALPDAIAVGIVASPEVLQEKAAAVKDFLAAVKQGSDMRHSTLTPQQMAADFRKVDAQGFASSSDASLVQQIKLSEAVLQTEPVSESLWTESLASYSQYQIPNFNATSPAIAYSAFVDDSDWPGS